MPTKSAKTAKTAKKPSPVVVQSGYLRFRRKVEEMYPLHLAMLLVLVSLCALLVTMVVKQQSQVDSLEFRLNFMQDRLESERAKTQDLIKPEAMKAEPTGMKPKVAPVRQ